ncbi:MAG: HesA/MoeB/ThiF family protein [Desulfobacteraceae bacterium]|nr:MAG: HesA/MoeB/ThiF family protein [Desulfobacteraceae bacterium]
MEISVEERYLRNLNTLSPQDQNTLSGAVVCVIGLGGLGGGVCEMLARTGVGHLIMVDGDSFDISNLNRQLFCQESLIGQSKALAAQKRIQAVNATVKCTVHQSWLDDSNVNQILDGADLVVDCLDSISARFLLQAGARTAGIPLVSGAIAGVAGQVITIYPDDPGFELIYPDEPAYQDPEGKSPVKRGVETQTGNLSFCAMLISAIQVSEAIKVLLGSDHVLRNRLLIVDLFRNSFETVELM